MTSLLKQVLEPSAVDSIKIPFGYCICGCRRKTLIAKYTDYRTGCIKGKPVRYCAGHQRRIPLFVRFWSQVKKSKKRNGCWEWIGSVGTNGYGQLGGWTDHKHYIIRTHRLSWEMHRGPIPKGRWVLHTCDNRRCVNPKHLFLGNHRINHADMMKKGRNGWKAFKGEANGSAVLRRRDVVRIRKLRKGGGYYHTIAEQFNVSRSLIFAICRRLLWKHVQ